MESDTERSWSAIYCFRWYKGFIIWILQLYAGGNGEMWNQNDTIWYRQSVYRFGWKQHDSKCKSSFCSRSGDRNISVGAVQWGLFLRFRERISWKSWSETVTCIGKEKGKTVQPCIQGCFRRYRQAFYKLYNADAGGQSLPRFPDGSWYKKKAKGDKILQRVVFERGRVKTNVYFISCRYIAQDAYK